MTIAFLGIDLAKNVFALHGVDATGRACLVRPSVRRDQLLESVAKLPPCTIGMEACSGAHHWARQFADFGHTVRLMAPKFVAPYRMSGRRGKNDAADAAAICEAVQRPAMRFVPIKSELSQCRLANFGGKLARATSANEWSPHARLSSGSAAQTAAAKTGCSFAVRTLFSLSVAGFVCVGWIV